MQVEVKFNLNDEKQLPLVLAWLNGLSFVSDVATLPKASFDKEAWIAQIEAFEMDDEWLQATLDARKVLNKEVIDYDY